MKKEDNYTTEDLERLSQQFKETLEKGRASLEGEHLTAERLTKDEFRDYLTYTLTEGLLGEEQEAKVKEMHDRVIPLSDVVGLVYAIRKHDRRNVAKVMESITVQQYVLDKLGATEEMYEEGQKKYDEYIKNLEKQVTEKSKKEDN